MVPMVVQTTSVSSVTSVMSVTPVAFTVAMFA